VRTGLGLAVFVAAWTGPAQASLLGERSGGAESRGTWVPDWAQPALSWVVEQQLAFHALLQDAVMAYKNGQSLAPALALIGIAFAYGVFHAVGPGHGKAVVSAFFLARDSHIKRGIAMGWSIAAIQAAVAIVLVGLVGILLDMGRMALLNSMPLVEAASYGLVVLLGLMMTWRAVAPMIRRSAGHEHRDHDHADACGHDHGTGGLRDDVAGTREFWGAALASGMRPCTGALIVLLFALANGIFVIGALAALAMGVGVALTISLIGIAAILARRGMILTLGGAASSLGASVISVLGSLAVLMIGSALLAGALVRL
jgi:nickel/cobalt exporter